MPEECTRKTRKRYLRTRALEENPVPPLAQTHQTPGSGSWLRSKVPPAFSSWFQPHRIYNPKESFFPFPKITFLIDEPPKLECQICRQAHCEIKSDTELVDETTFSMMPCGHAACSLCLDKWLRRHGSCPFCRSCLKYPGCGHSVPARLLTKEGLHLLPRTLPDRGWIPHLCARCLRESLLSQAESRFRQATQEFRDARRRFHETRAAADEHVLLVKREEFETVLRDQVYQRQLSRWLTSW